MVQPTKKTSMTTELYPAQETNGDENNLDPEDSRIWGSKRLVVNIFIFLGYIYLFILHGNLSIAIVEMTSNKTIMMGNHTIAQPAEFLWDSKIQGWILSVYTYGCFFTIIGGYLAMKFGGANLYGLGILVSGILTILTPITIRTSFNLFIAVRIAEGLLGNFSYVSSIELWSRWVPRKELPFTVSLCFIGYHIGEAVTYPLCGYLANHWGWPMIFYFSGTTAVIWCMFFFTFVRNDPSSHKTISAGELKYIREANGSGDRKNTVYPWKKIFTSKPVWALFACKFAYSWTLSVLVFSFPLYIEDITVNESTFAVGVLSGVPNYLSIIIFPLSGLLLDYLEHKDGLQRTTVHKWIICSGYLIGGLLFVLVGFTDFTTRMIFFIIIFVTGSVNIAVLQILDVHISPDHAGMIAGLSSIGYTSSSLIAPTLIGFIVTNHAWQEWNTYFILSGIILILAALINGFYGSSDDQKWSSESEIPQKTDRMESNFVTVM